MHMFARTNSLMVISCSHGRDPATQLGSCLKHLTYQYPKSKRRGEGGGDKGTVNSAHKTQLRLSSQACVPESIKLFRPDDDFTWLIVEFERRGKSARCCPISVAMRGTISCHNKIIVDRRNTRQQRLHAKSHLLAKYFPTFSLQRLSFLTLKKKQNYR